MTPSADLPPARPGGGRFRPWLFTIAAFLIILGVRFALIERFSSTVPLADDWLMMNPLEKWAAGQHDWGWLLARHNGTHLAFFSRGLAALSVSLNGWWDPRLDSCLHALVYALYAVVLAHFFARIVPERETLMRALVFFFFAVPFAGVRTTWAFLSCFDFCGAFAFLAFIVQAWHGDRKWALPVALLLAVAASFSLGSGCLAGLAMAAVACAEMLASRRLTKTGVLWCVPGLAIFLGFYLTMGKPEATTTLPPFVLSEAISAACKALAWPIFLTPLAVSAIVPLFLLLWRWFRGDSALRSDPRMRALMLAWAWLVLQGAAIGFMRGENGNMGIPSNRYNDLLMPFVFVEAATLLFLMRDKAPRCLRLVRNAWVLLLVSGISLHVLWRTWPFMAHENGEYNEWVRQRNVREFFRGNPEPLRTAQAAVKDTSTIFMIGESLEPVLTEIAAGKWKIKSAGAMAGIPLTFPEGAGVNRDGLPPEYFRQPAQEYYGTFTAGALEGATGRGVSAPFAVSSSWLLFDLVIDKKARFKNYSLDGLTLRLVPAGGGEAVDVLAALKRQAPFMVRDRESVCVPVTPGEWRLEYADESPDLWIGFSAPLEGGRAAGLVHRAVQSSKVLIAAGILLLAGLALTRPTAPAHG